MTALAMHDRFKWEVRWVNDDKEIEIEDFGSDLPSATKFYSECVSENAKTKPAAYRAVTLRCKNIGFPPPDKYANKTVEIVTVRGKRYKKTTVDSPKRYDKAMREFNARGWWWCPYCMQLRKFVKTPGFWHDGIYVPEARLCCPLCEASHKLVVQFNPIAARIIEGGGPIADPQRDVKRKRRRDARRAAKKAQ